MNFKSGILICVCLQLASISLFTSCSKEDDKNLLIEDCDSSGAMLGFFIKIKNQSDFITSYEEEMDCYIFHFNINASVAIPKKCISQLTENIHKGSLTIRYFDGLSQEISLGELKEISYIHNPAGSTPLSGMLLLDSDLPGTIYIAIKNKGNYPLPERSYAYNNRLMEIPVLGLYYNFENEIYIRFARSGRPEFRDTFRVDIGQQPAYFPQIIIDRLDTSKMEAGLHFISFRSKSDPTIPFMVDNEGEIRYVLDYSLHPDLSTLNYDVGMERLRNGNFYFGNWPTSDIYEVDILGRIVNRWQIPGYEFHHTVQEKSDGNFLVTATKYNDLHASGNMALEDYILELDRNSGAIINVWDLKISLDEMRSTLGSDVFGNYIDWIHVNAVIEDPTDNTIIISGRYQGIIKLDYDNQVKWILNCHRGWGNNRKGEDLNEFLLTPLDQSSAVISNPLVHTGEENHIDFEWPWYQHAPFLMENGNLFVFDNGERRNYNFSQQYSRAVEYRIDASEMSVQQIWQYGKERGIETYSRIVSDVDFLPQTGNILFCPGSRVNNGSGFGGKIVEINYDTKEVVFEMRLFANDIVFHRAERMPLYP